MSSTSSPFCPDACLKNKSKSKSSSLKKLFFGKSKASRDSMDSCGKTLPLRRSVSSNTCSSSSSDEFDHKMSMASVNTKSSKISQVSTHSNSSTASKKSKWNYNMDRFCGSKRDESCRITQNAVWQQAFMYSAR